MNDAVVIFDVDAECAIMTFPTVPPNPLIFLLVGRKMPVKSVVSPDMHAVAQLSTLKFLESESKCTSCAIAGVDVAIAVAVKTHIIRAKL